MVFFAQSRAIYFLFHYFNLCMPIKNKNKQTKKQKQQQQKKTVSGVFWVGGWDVWFLEQEGGNVNTEAKSLRWSQKQ